MNPRISELRSRSLEAKPYLSPERARLITEFYKNGTVGRAATPLTRAFALKHVLSEKSISIEDGELIVGERGRKPKAAPTFPEICTHHPRDLDILKTREKISYDVSNEARRQFEEEFVPFWKGRSIRDRIFGALDDEWKAAYEAGVFTEFMEQRAPGHTVLGDKIYRKGMLDIKADIEQRIGLLDFLNDPDALAKRDELQAMLVAADALIAFAGRYAALAREMAKSAEPDRKQELERIAEICEWVPAHAPRTFWEALQYYWFVHLGVITELNTWDSFSPGRLDQHLYPFYRKELDAGTLTEESAKELLEAFWIKFNNQPAPPKVGVTAEESGTYTDFCLINLGGLTEDGEDAVNDLTYLLLDVVEEMRLLQPSSMVQISEKSPDRFLRRALEIVKTGFGQPSFFNTEAIVQELVKQGKTIEDARNGGASGCVEAGAFGKEAYILTGYFNLVKILEITLHNGVDPSSGKLIGLETGDPASWDTFDDLMEAYAQQLRHFVDVKIKGSLIIERLYARYLPAPFLSLLIDDCIANGKDYNDGGARYNTSYIQGVGLGTITDSLTAIKHQVFDRKNVSLTGFIEALDANFDGWDDLREHLLNGTPKYGNDDEYADEVMRRVFECYFDAIDGRPNTRGGFYRVNLLPTTCHVYFGSVVGATPDGRMAYEPLSEGISPVQGADRSGPTAVLKSAAKLDTLRTGGTLLNQKFTPSFLKDDTGIEKLIGLVRGYFRMNGHHIQFNVVSAETLREAQEHPEKYPDLIVRVAGYSDYFVDLGVALQDEIIRRTEQITA